MSVPNPISLPSELSGRTLTLNLILHAGNTVTVRSCEVVGAWFRNRISFQENRTLEDVLAAKLAHAILAHLKDLPAGAHVLALPEFLVEVPGLALSGLHVMVMDAKEGKRNAILRFTEFVGALNSSFRIEIGFQDPYPSYSDKLAVNILEEICLPILNLCQNFAGLEHDNHSMLPRDFADRAREFEFQTELLKRYIYNAALKSARDKPYQITTQDASLNHYIID